MGLLYANAKLMLQAKASGLCFDRIVTLGRQQLFITPSEFASLQTEFPAAAKLAAGSLPATGEFCEPFFQELLGATEIQSIDFSDFEGASLIHDMNHPIDKQHHEQFDAVIDGGTIEHIFNIPTTLANCMQMVKVGGCVILATTANNHCGHGFYQFSPELFYRVFSEENGFSVDKMILLEHPYPGVELSDGHRHYEVVDPDRVKHRVGLVNHNPTLVLVLAKRVSKVVPFQTAPQQSDYQTRWQSHENNASEIEDTATASRPMTIGRAYRGVKNRMVAKLPRAIQKRIQGREQRHQYSFSNDEFYRRW